MSRQKGSLRIKQAESRLNRLDPKNWFEKTKNWQTIDRLPVFQLLKFQNVIRRAVQISAEPCQYVKVNSRHFAFAVVIKLSALQPARLADFVFADIFVFQDSFKINVNHHSENPSLYKKLYVHLY